MTDPIELRVLLIEDDEDDAVLCADVAADVETMDIDLVWEPDAEASIERTRREAFDVILLDYQLGSTTGLAVMERLREDRLQAPIVLLTGHSDPETGRMMVRRGADDFLGKLDLSPSTLQRAIMHAMERRSYVETIQRRDALHRAVLSSLHEGVLALDASGIVVSANDGAARLLEVARESLLGSTQPLAQWRVTDIDRRELTTADLPWSRSAAGGGHGSKGVIGLWRDDDLVRWLSVSVRPWVRQDGHVEGTVASLADVTRTQRVQEELQFKAFHDPLTGLPNRELFHDRLGQALKLQERGREHALAVLFLDLDRFKEINDTWGHAAGDALLQEVAHRVQGVLRKHDTLARLGGDEFVVLQQDIDRMEDAIALAERILTAVGTPLEIGDAVIAPSTSIGIAVQLTGSAEPEALLQRADDALYEAKRASRGTYRLAGPAPSTT